jgi:hypothetical protein
LIGEAYGRGLPFLVELFPFVEAVEGYQATPTAEGFAEGRLRIDPLRLGIDVGKPDLDVFAQNGTSPQRMTSRLRCPALAS